MKLNNHAELFVFPIEQRDIGDLETDVFSGASINVIAGTDTVRFTYVNLSYQQWHYVPIKSPTKKGKLPAPI